MGQLHAHRPKSAVVSHTNTCNVSKFLGQHVLVYSSIIRLFINRCDLPVCVRSIALGANTNTNTNTNTFKLMLIRLLMRDYRATWDASNHM